MWLNKKAQSTAEYAITLGLVIAVAAGIMSVALKGGMRQKNEQAVNYLLNAGSDVTDFSSVDDQSVALYSQEYRDTTILSGDTNFIDKTVLNKGGAEKRHQLQTSLTNATSIETINEQ